MALDRQRVVFAIEPQTARQDEPSSGPHPAPKTTVSFRSAPHFPGLRKRALGRVRQPRRILAFNGVTVGLMTSVSPLSP